MVPGASIARLAHEHGVNPTQVFEWRYEHRKRSSGTPEHVKADMLLVTLAAETHTPSAAEVAPPAAPSSGSIYIELPGRAVISIESGVATSPIRAGIESLLRRSSYAPGHTSGSLLVILTCVALPRTDDAVRDVSRTGTLLETWVRLSRQARGFDHAAVVGWRRTVFVPAPAGAW